MADKRSPNYPAMSLTQCIGWAEGLWRKEKRTPVSPDVVIKALGYQTLSGASRTALASLKQYGLLEKTPQGLRLSELAMRILHPPSAEHRGLAISEAASTPALFRELKESHADASDDALRSHLLIAKGFSEAGTRAVIKAFRDANGLAKPGDMADNPNEDTQMNGDFVENTGRSAALPVVKAPLAHIAATRVFTWPLSRGVTAEVRFSGGAVNESHLDVLSKYLELAKSAMKIEEDGVAN